MPKASKAKATSSRRDPLASSSRSVNNNNGRHRNGGNGASSASAAISTRRSYQFATAPAYLFWVHLPTQSPPSITRCLRVPGHFTFEQFHEVLQVAFGWSNSHMYTFEVNTLTTTEAMRQEAANAPLDDRFILPNGPVPIDPTHVMSLVQGGYDVGMRTERHIAMTKGVEDVRLTDVFLNDDWLPLGLKLLYEYDMGDGWEHHIQFLGVADRHLALAMGLDAEQQVFCIGGQGHPCVEDCGGEWGFEEVKEAFREPESEGARAKRDWFARVATNGDAEGFDPWEWDVVKVNRKLKRLRF